MAAPLKPGLDYFPFDVTFFQDIKIRKLIKYQGCQAISVYTLLLCNIYKNGYYMRWDEELPFIISETTGFEEGYVKEVLIACRKVGLFSEGIFERWKVLTSKGIQERYVMICQKAKRKFIIDEFNLINTEVTKVNSEVTKVNSEFSQQRKVKENKEKKSDEETEKESSSSSSNEIPDFVKKEQQKLADDLKNNPPEFRATPPSLDEYLNQMQNSRQLLETACMTRKITEYQFRISLNEFILEKKAINHAPKSYTDAAQHYLNWLTIWKSKKDKSELDVHKGGKLRQQANSLASASQKIKSKGGYLTSSDIDN